MIDARQWLIAQIADAYAQQAYCYQVAAQWMTSRGLDRFGNARQKADMNWHAIRHQQNGAFAFEQIEMLRGLLDLVDENQRTPRRFTSTGVFKMPKQQLVVTVTGGGGGGGGVGYDKFGNRVPTESSGPGYGGAGGC